MSQPVSAVSLLVDWMQKNKITQSELARKLLVNQSSVFSWLAGHKRPDEHRREAIEVLTGIPKDEWRTEQEKESLAEIVRKINEGAHA